MKLMFLLVLFFTSPLLGMELAISSQILSQPDMIKLIAYALVDTTQRDSLVDNPSKSYSSESCKASKQLLVALQNFSANHKTIHDIIYKLIYGIDEEAIRFNCHFYTRMGGHVTTAAFMGTPWALNIILDTRFKELYAKHGKKTAIKELNKLLSARFFERVPRSIQFVPNVSFRNFYLIFRINNNGKKIDYESITKTMAKFPQSTRQFILNLE